VSFSPSNYGASGQPTAPSFSPSGNTNTNSSGSGSGSGSPGATARRRSADFSSLKNQIALSLEERDNSNARDNKEKEARAELLREVREHGGNTGSTGAINNNYRATAKLQDFGKNLLGRAKKLKGSRVGGKDAVGAADDDDDYEDSKSGGTPMGSQENMRNLFSPADLAAATAGGPSKEPSPRPTANFPGRGNPSPPFSHTPGCPGLTCSLV
jgi:hypothetical protein